MISNLELQKIEKILNCEINKINDEFFIIFKETTISIPIEESSLITISHEINTQFVDKIKGRVFTPNSILLTILEA